MNFLSELILTPFLLIGLITMIGSIIQKRSTDQVIKATINASIGFLLLEIGSSYLSSDPLQMFDQLFQFAFHIHGILPHNELVIAAAIEKTATNTSLILFFGMLCNLLIARFSCLKYIFLSGHHAFYMACLICIALEQAGMNGWQLIVAGSLLSGLAMSLFPALAQKPMRHLTKGDKMALGHFSTIGYLLSWKVGMAIKKRSKDPLRIRSTEQLKFPKSIGFLRDTNVLIALFMTLMFTVVCFAARHQAGYEQLAVSSQNLLVFSIENGMKFTCGIVIVLTGVRMTIGEIVPAFKGIAKKFVPDAKPAIDCPILFTYAPNAVMIGFLSSFSGSIVFMFFSLILQSFFHMEIPIIIPAVIVHFFCGATAGIFGNIEGGWKGCVLGAFLTGFFLSALSLGSWWVLNSLRISSTVSDSDFSIVMILSILAGRIMPTWALFGLIVALYLFPFIINMILERKREQI